MANSTTSSSRGAMPGPRLPLLPPRITRAFREFVQNQAAGGIILILFTVLALAWANSPWYQSYTDLFGTYLTVGLGDWEISKPLLLWINDGLMAIFFFLVGLEIKREVLVGELASVRRAMLPVSAAVGGMAIPALIYLIFNAGSDGARGWGIPMATDIAFALGVLALLGSRAPITLKIFLTAVAIVDDIGAVLVIALFYTDEVAVMSLLVGAGFLAALIGANRLGVQRGPVYVLLGLGLWVAVLQSGVHATVAGVLLAMTIPARAWSRGPAGDLHDEHESLLLRLEHGLQPWVAFAIIPLFAIANAGVRVEGDFAGQLSDPIALGIILGLLIGKQIGVTGFAWLSVRTGIAALPPGISWRQIHGVSSLAAMGFTMSLFIATLAFGDPAVLDTAKIAILVASLAAGVLGWSLLRWSPSSAVTADVATEYEASRTDSAVGAQPR